jgi:hypothetical protein
MHVYSLSYDERRLTGYDMNDIVWLSPWYHPDTDGPYWVATSVERRGSDAVVDKVMIARPLETGVRNPESLSPSDFMLRAESNLAKDRSGLVKLTNLKLPPVLEPVRNYLVNYFQFDIRIEELRYGYIKTGNVHPLAAALCSECSCGSLEQEILDELERVQEFPDRVHASWKRWPNAMNDCHLSRKPMYPVAAWEAFLREFGIDEHHKETGLE